MSRSIQLDDDLRSEYEKLFATAVIRSTKKVVVAATAERVKAGQSRYQTVAAKTGVPWFVIGAIHSLEADCNWKTHLHNGDSLSARTRHVPAGRPKLGHPPFTWEFSAIDSIQLERLDTWTDWSLAGCLYKLEAYNGWGYRQHHRSVKTPYLWSYSSIYSRGKYVGDGSWSSVAVSDQCGAAVILLSLNAQGIIAFQS